MFEWLLILIIAALLFQWLRVQSGRPCSGCDGCKAHCSSYPNRNKTEVHQDGK